MNDGTRKKMPQSAFQAKRNPRKPCFGKCTNSWMNITDRIYKIAAAIKATTCKLTIAANELGKIRGAK